MSRASNTLTTSDVLTTPIKIKYSSSYDSSSYYSAGIRVLKGVNGYISTTGSVPQATLNYRSVRHLFYSNYLTGSFPTAASAALNWEQSTAASGTLDADVRNFPTGSGNKIKILSISRHGFELVAQDGHTYDIVDDGNGNLIDIASTDLYVDVEYFSPGESFTTGYVSGPSKNTPVGNIIYSQGIIIITNPEYYDILDAGPELFNRVYTFYDTDIPKDFNPLSNAQPDSSPINTSSLALIPIPNQQFPSYGLVSSLVTLDPADPLYVTVGSYYIDYNVISDIGTPSNTANINVNIIANCSYTLEVSSYFRYGKISLLFDFADKALYSNTGTTIPDLAFPNSYGPGIFSLGGGNGTPTTVTGYTTAGPGYLALPGATQPNEELSIRLDDVYKSDGNTSFTFAAWVNLQTLGGIGTTPGIVAAEGVNGLFNPATTYDGLGGGDTVLLPWSRLGSLGGPIYNQWFFLFVTYDGSNELTVGSYYNNLYIKNTVASTTAITSNPNYGCFVGQRYGEYPQAYFGYLAGYFGSLTPGELGLIYNRTKARYGQ